MSSADKDGSIPPLPDKTDMLKSVAGVIINYRVVVEASPPH